MVWIYIYCNMFDTIATIEKKLVPKLKLDDTKK